MVRSRKSYVKKQPKPPVSRTKLMVREGAPARAALVHMNQQGRITLPALARRKLGIVGEADLLLELDGNVLMLRPAVVLPVEDAWAYTSTHRQLLKRAHSDSREGRIRSVSEQELGN